MKLSAFVGRMSALKNELISVLPKVTDSKTYLSNMDQIFMILILIKLGIEFDNIREHILTGFAIPAFDEIFSLLLCHSSTATRSRHFEASPNTSVMLAPSNPCSDSRSTHGGHQGRGQRPYCTYCNGSGHLRDQCYQLHGHLPRTAHIAQSFESPPPLAED